MPESPRKIPNSMARVGFSLVIMMMLGVANIVRASETSIDFTPQEKAYIAKTGAIKMCVDPDWAPFESINKAGQHEGIAADLVKLVAQRVGLRIDLHPVKDWDESLAASKAKICQIMSFLNQTPDRDAWLIFTSTIFFDPNVIITREEHGFIADAKGLQGESIALPRGTMVEERVRRDFQNLSVVLTASEPEAMTLVSERKADLTIRSLIVAANAIKKEGLFNLKIAGQIPEYTNQLRIGVLKDETVLRSILDKGVQTITPQEREAIANKHVSISIQQGIDWTRIYILLALLAIAALVVLYILRNNRRLQHALTASQNARSALRISEERHRLLADNASDVIWTMDLMGRFTYVSPSVERLRGYSAAEVMQQTIDQALTPESAKIAAVGLGLAIDAIHAKQPVADFRAELEQPCKQGGTVWTEVNVTGIQNELGEFVNLLGVTRDISDRKRAELDLRIAAAAFESQDGMVVTDADRVILRVNSAFTQITGYTAEEAIGQTPRMLRSDRHDESFYAALWESIELAGAWHGEIWHQRKNGEIYPEQLTITAVKAGGGQITHYVATLRDITQRKQLEEEVQQLAYYDPLTRLPNRRLFNDRLSQTLLRAKRAQSRMALMFIDLDKFKPINDQHGHEAGDWVLEAVARRIESCLRASDTVARVGGDEFLVLLPDIQTGGDVLAVAEKIRVELGNAFITPNQLSLRASSSIGIAIYPDHANTEEDLLRLGDHAMYKAKSMGGHAVELCALSVSAEAQDTDDNSSAGQSIVRLMWKADFACGHEAIDGEHRELFRLSNVLLGKMATRTEKPVPFEEAFDALLAHVVKHFAHEEEILQDYAYERLQEHAKIHQSLVAQALKLRHPVDREPGVSVGELVDFLVNEVVARHMLNEDRKFSQLFSDEGASLREDAERGV